MMGEHLRITLRLSARNRMALAYGYLFPLVFLLSFLVLYRSEDPLLLRHMGELLTVGVLGTACFGLPTSLVSERERGVWRRYRLTPATTGSLVASTLAARYVTVLGAILLQLGLAMAIGRWVPAHPFDLWVAVSLVTVALLGLGLVVAAMADTVPAAQALGQCVFLPMLIIGGVAVRIDALPEWLVPVTAFLPGRYAVEAIQACIDGGGLGAARFPLVALLMTGAASCLAGIKLFRWDSETRFLSLPDKSWVAVALGAWVVVGGLAIQHGETAPRRAGPSVPLLADVTAGAPANVQDRPARAGGPAAPPDASDPNVPSPSASTLTPAAPTGPIAATQPWRALTQFDFAALAAEQVPPDDGNISPIAADDEAPAGSSAEWLQKVEGALPSWPPGHVPNRVQRVRNYLLILAVADFAQSPIERFLPGVVLAHMLKESPPQELAQLVCWVALHSDQGNVSALADPLLVELGAATLDQDELRTRTFYYGVKLTRRIIGRP